VAWSDRQHPLTALTLDDLRQRTSAKWRVYPPDVLPLWIAEMDVPLAEPVAAAVVEAVRRGDTGYAFGRDYPQALAHFAERRWGWSPDVADSVVVADVMRGVVETLRLVTEPGDPVVVNPPVYPPFYAFVEHDGRRVVEAPLDGRGRVDLERLEQAFDRTTATSPRVAYLLCNPHNPTGAVHSRGELTAIAGLARTYGVRVVSDEIHAPLVLPGATFTPYLTVAGADDAFAVLSASKAWNLAGLKAAVVLAGEQARPDLRRMPEEVAHGPSHLGVIAHTAALRDGEPWLDDLLADLDANRDLLGRLLAQHLPQVGYQPPEGTYLAWLDCRSLAPEAGPAGPGSGGRDGGALTRRFLEAGRVALTSGHTFGTGGDGHVRLNLATSPAILTDAVQGMAAAVAVQPSPCRPQQ
jgi:cystathionine beta-lyase